MVKEFDMFDDFFKEEDFTLDDEKEEELEELELETDNPEDYPDDPIPVDPTTKDSNPALPDPDVDVTCDCEDDDGCDACSLDPADDPFCDPDDCDCNQCHGHSDGWDTGKKTNWDTGGGTRPKPTDKGVWKPKPWKT